MIDLSVNCSPMRAKLTELGCRQNQAIRECCLTCERRDKRIKYVGLLSEFVRDQNVRGGINGAISKAGVPSLVRNQKHSRRSSTEDEQSHDKRKAEGSSPSGGTKKQGGAGRSLAEKTPIVAGDSTLRVVASVTRKAPPPKHTARKDGSSAGLISLPSEFDSRPRYQKKGMAARKDVQVARRRGGVKVLSANGRIGSLIPTIVEPSGTQARTMPPNPIDRPAQMAHARESRWPGYLRPARRVA